MRPDNDGRAVPVYLLLVFALSSIFYALIIKSGHVAGGRGYYVIAIMWCPAAAALLTCKHLGRDVSSLGWKWAAPRYIAASYLVPLAYATVAYAAAWLSGFAGFYNRGFVDQTIHSFGLGPMPHAVAIALYFVFTATAGMVRSCSTALGEEIGWRGFLVPELAKRHSFTITALISGCVWAVWHYPVLLLADYNSGAPAWCGLPCFTVMVVASSFIFAWIRLKSGSLWTGMLLHASHNIFIQTFFDPLTVPTSRSPYVTGEFGVALAVVTVLFAVWFWSRRGEFGGRLRR